MFTDLSAKLQKNYEINKRWNDKKCKVKDKKKESEQNVTMLHVTLLQ